MNFKRSWNKFDEMGQDGFEEMGQDGFDEMVQDGFEERRLWEIWRENGFAKIRLGRIKTKSKVKTDLKES